MPREPDLSPAPLTILPTSFSQKPRDLRFNECPWHDLTAQKFLPAFPKFEVGHIHSRARCVTRGGLSHFPGIRMICTPSPPLAGILD
jgi:hypothetical protein